MKKRIRIAIAQINCTVGDIRGNCEKITDYLGKAIAAGADIAAFPELAVTGYPPEDLLLKESFIDDNIDALKKIAKSAGDIAAVVGFVDRKGIDIYNAAAVVYGGEIKGIYHKAFLPNYSVFDEKRYFKAGMDAPIFKLGGLVFGVNICEDIWHKEGPLKKQAALGARLIVNINSSPYYMGRIKEREEIVCDQAKTNKVFVSYTNLVGGQDELVFDGQSMVIDPAGHILARARGFSEELLIADIDMPFDEPRAVKNLITVSGAFATHTRTPLKKSDVKPLDPISEVYQALVLGLKDYVTKNGFKKCVMGLSGGIDSAFVASLAVDAIGKENVVGVFMPTRYSSQESEDDAREVAANLGIEFLTISIDQIFKLYLMALEPKFIGKAKDITEENIQARIRGTMIMALSNKFGWLVLTTGNKSEMSTGYATLYGDMAGGLAIIKDVYKTLVYKLARYRNSIGSIIPESVLTKEPTAELRAGQKDSDTLPPYKVLDKILKAYVEEDKGSDEIVKAGFDKDIVYDALAMVDRSEYKRRQSPPGIKITPKAFGKDRRMPITNKYK